MTDYAIKYTRHTRLCLTLGYYRLEQRLRQQKAKLSKAMKQVNNDSSITPEAKLRAVSFQNH